MVSTDAAKGGLVKTGQPVHIIALAASITPHNVKPERAEPYRGCPSCLSPVPRGIEHT